MTYDPKPLLQSSPLSLPATSTVTQPKSASLIDKYKDDRHFVTALARGLEVLACFRSGNRVLGNQDIAKRCNLSNSTVSRLTSTLVKMGYLMHDAPTGKYRLGMATLSLGMGMLAKLDVRQIARPYLQEIADFSQGVVSLGVRDRLSMLCIETCRSRSALTLQLDVGTRLPITTSSMGRAYLAEAGQVERGREATRQHNGRHDLDHIGDGEGEGQRRLVAGDDLADQDADGQDAGEGQVAGMTTAGAQPDGDGDAAGAPQAGDQPGRAAIGHSHGDQDGDRHACKHRN